MGAKSTGSHPTTTKADGHLLEYFRQTFGAGGGGTNAPPGASGLTATGGVISEYTSGPATYRAHIFTSSGTFSVSAIGDFPAEVDYLVIGGGGAGGYNAGGGGGAGAFRTSIPGHTLAQPSITVSTSPGSYTVTIGAGGAGGTPSAPNRGGPGGDTVFGPITSPGGGGGGGETPSPHRGGTDGGSGGGGGMGYSGGDGAFPGSPNPSPFRMGYDGGNGSDNGGDNIAAGGGGGAGGAGSNGTAPDGPGGPGGAGSPIAIESATAKLYAGGGAGGSKDGQGTGGPGGGGIGGHRPSLHGGNATASTGSGGGGGATSPPAGRGGNGAGGIVVVRYKIAESETGNAQATGGAISFYGGKTIHTFTSSGSFVNTAQITDAEFVLVGGGGGGGYPQGGGGGAGGMVVHTGPFTIPGPATNAVVVGGGGSGLGQDETPANPGTTTTLTFPGTPVTYSAYRGGGSGPAPIGSEQGGSGAGGSYNGGTGKSATNPATNPGATEYGNAGANHNAFDSGGGGGGAGAAGSGADAGRGRQLPTTYRNPDSAGNLGTPGPDPGGFYVAGGGAAYWGSSGTTRPAAAGGGGGGPITFPQPVSVVQNANNGRANTGGGGAGPYIVTAPNTYNPKSGNGGSGIVLIAYPT